MADDNNQRPYRSNETRATPQASPASGSDPLAELARLIGQTDPFAEYGRDAGHRAPSRPADPSADWPQQNTNPTFPSASPARAPATQPDGSQMQPFGGTHYEPQRYDTSSFTNSAGLYRTENDPAAFAPSMQDEGYSGDQYYQDGQHSGAEEDIYDDVPPPRRRMGVMVIAAVFALAVVGTAGAFGYRALFGSSGSTRPPPVIKADATPSKIVPSASSKESNKLITDRVGDNGRNEKLVSREEQPVDMKDNPAGAAMTANQAVQPSAPLMPANGSGIVTAEPKKIRTIVIRPDQVGMADATPASASAKVDVPPVKQAVARTVAPQPPAEANVSPAPAVPEPRPAVTRTPPAAPVQRTASNNAPLSLNPNDSAPAPARAAAPARPAPAATAPQAASSGGYAVQVSSQRSEVDAQAAFRNMQSKYPNQLGGRSPIIHRVDLGAKGIYFRAMVGPFANGNEASQLCSSLKSAGGQCIVQKI